MAGELMRQIAKDNERLGAAVRDALAKVHGQGGFSTGPYAEHDTFRAAQALAVELRGHNWFDAANVFDAIVQALGEEARVRKERGICKCGLQMDWVDATRSWYCPECHAVVNVGNT